MSRGIEEVQLEVNSNLVLVAGNKDPLSPVVRNQEDNSWDSKCQLIRGEMLS